MHRITLVLLINISLINASIIENNSSFIIYAIKDSSSSKIPEFSLIDAMFDPKYQIPPNSSQKIKESVHLIAHVPILFKHSINEFKYLGNIKVSCRKKHIITNDLILFIHLGKHGR